MKTIKYLVAGLLLASLSVPAMAQTSQADIDAITKVIVDAKGDAVATKDQVKEFKKAHKKDAVALAGLGRAFLEVKNYQMAEEIANLAIKANGKSAEGYILLGDIASAQDDGGKAAGFYEQGTYYEPANPTSYVRYATVYQKVDPDGAVAMLEKLRAVKPDYPVDAAAGRMYSRNGQLKSAMAHYDKVADPTTIEDYILFDYALTAYALEDYDKAVSLAQKGIQKYPSYGAFNRVVLYASDKQKNYPTAVEYGDKLFAATDTVKYTASDYTYYADALLNVGRIDDAISAYKHITEVDPENKEVNKLISEAYVKAKKFPEAVAAYEAYLAAKGDECTYKEYDNFADIYLEESEAATDEAAKKAALKKAADIYGQIAEKFDYAAVYALFKQANFYHAINPDLKVGLALPYYKKLIDKIESQSEKSAGDLKKLGTAYQYLAVHYIQNDKVADAKQWAAKLLEVRPDDETAKQIMNLK